MNGKKYNDAFRWHLEELAARVVAQSGIPSDRYHLGKMILQSFKDAPDFVLQIDGSTGKSETFGSLLKRTTNCANCLKNIGLQTGDVIVIMAPNNLDITVPFYAALYLGIMVSAVDSTLGIREIENSFKVTQPKVIFCDSDRATDVQVALNEVDINAKIVTFGKGDYLCSFQEFMHKYSDYNAAEDFRPSNFDPADTIAFLIPTSGTTGLPKSAAVTHKNALISMPCVWSRNDNFPTPTRLVLLASPLQWLTAIIVFVLSPIMRFTRLQTPLRCTKDHFYHLMNTYKPTWATLSPPFMISIVKASDIGLCDLSSLETLFLAGSAIPNDLFDEIKSLTPETELFNMYGMTEITSIGFVCEPQQSPKSCGKPIPSMKYRLIDSITGDDIYELNTPGELWLKGPGIFKEYLNNPEATAETFAEDRWFKTGDMFYRDEKDFFYFVERIKLLMKYKGNQISPVELEAVIRKLPGILDVAVTSVPDPESGDLPVACVVLRDGHYLTEQDIKDVVADNLSDPKQLRGGVLFLDSLPLTASSKVHRQKLKEMVKNLQQN